MEDAANAFRALGDEGRLKIMGLLSVSELCCCEITDVLGRRDYNISRDLKALHRAGLVNVRKEGRWAYYSLNRSDQFRKEILSLVDAALKGKMESDEENLKRRLAMRVDGKCVIGPHGRRGKEGVAHER